MKKIFKLAVAICFVLVLSIGISPMTTHAAVFESKNVTPSGGYDYSSLKRQSSRNLMRVHKESGTGLLRKAVSSPTGSPLLRESIERVNASGTNPLYGSLVYSDEWIGSYGYGIYSVATDGTYNVSPVYEHSNLNASAGGVFVDGKYFLAFEEKFGGMPIGVWYMWYDTDTFECLRQEEGDITFYAYDLAYDETSKKVYGCFKSANGTGVSFCSMDFNTAKRTEIAQLETIFNGMAFDAEGNCYAVTVTGDFVKVDKTTGKLTVIGSTGLSPYYPSSAAFDVTSNTFYYAYCPQYDRSGLYSINLTTGEASRVCYFNNGEEFRGLYVKYPDAASGAPAAVGNLHVNFEGASLSGMVCFTAPSVSFSGNPITGSLSYTIKANDDVIATGTMECGTTMEVPVELTQDGKTLFAVTVSNSEGESPASKINVFVGEDEIKELQNVLLKYEDGKLKLSWDTPTGANGGYIDASKVTYKITRYPDNVLVAKAHTGASFEEPLPTTESGLFTYYYAIKPKYNGEESYSSWSNRCTGGYLIPPYKQDFSNGTYSLDGYTIIDANNDGYQWSAIHDRLAIGSNSGYDKDDWVITPPIRLEAGRTYSFTFDAAASSITHPETVEGWFGTEATVGGMQLRVIEPAIIRGSGDEDNEQFTTLEGYVNVKTTSDYYFGIHGCSPAVNDFLYVTNITVSTGVSGNVPEAVSELSIIPDENSRLRADISFRTPDKTINGDPLSSLSKIEVYRNNGTSPIKTFDSPALNTILRFTDENAENGNNTYRVIAYNEEGAGRAAVGSAYIGVVIPAPPASATFVENASNPGEVTISWEPVTTDVNGKEIDSSLVTYTVAMMLSGASGESQIVGSGIKGNTYTCQAVTDQAFVYFLVYSETAAGLSNTGADTQMAPVGQPYKMPYVESFVLTDTGRFNTIWGTTTPQGSGAEWITGEGCTNPVATPQDNDGSMIGFVSDNKGEESTIFSGKISLEGASNPALSFYYYAVKGANEELNVLFDTGDGLKTVKTINIGETGKDGWTKVVVMLKDCGANVVCIGFTGHSVNAEKIVLLDNIRVAEIFRYDLCASDITVPSLMLPNHEYAINVTAENYGLSSVQSYSIDLFRNGESISTKKCGELAPGMSASASFMINPTPAWPSEMEYYAVINYDNDDNMVNNTTSTVNSQLRNANSYPAVSDLKGTIDADNKVELTWSAPDPNEADGKPVIDDFETYDSFAIDNVGDWVLIDRDGAISGGFESLSIPHLLKDPIAFMVFDNSGLSNSFDAYSGNKYMMAVFNYQDAPNDDWLVSPELSGDVQTISFYAKPYDGTFYPETFEVLYSTGSTDASDFTKVDAKTITSDDWEEYSFLLPKGAKRFAIRYVSNYQFALFIDNVSYIPANSDLKILGYNIYRNGEKINPSTVTSESYTDIFTPDCDKYVYNVTVVYDKGESSASNDATVKMSGISLPVADNGVLIMAQDQSIIIKNADGQTVSVFTVDGCLIANTRGTHQMNISVEPGIYIVNVGAKATKIFVK